MVPPQLTLHEADDEASGDTSVASAASSTTRASMSGSGVKRKSVFAKSGTYHDYRSDAQIVLLIDTREQAFVNCNEQMARHMLQRLPCMWERRALAVGDFAWILRVPTDDNGIEEHMLHCIVERKTAEDLKMSRDDNRYREQRHRLAKTGFQHAIYLVEADAEELARAGEL